MRRKDATLALALTSLLAAMPALAVELSVVSGSVGKDITELRDALDRFEKQSGNTVRIVEMPASTTDQFGQYRLWLSAGNPDIDVYRTDVIWAPQLANHFVDLTEAAKDQIPKHFPSIIQSQTVGGKLVALPMYTDAPALYYRKDLLDKYGKQPPKTWEELKATAQEVLDKEHAAGNGQLVGFVFQGAPYEGLTCDGLEWVSSYGGGQIVDPKGNITINNPKAEAALAEARSWIGTVSPTGVLAYKEEEARGVWQTGNAIFMRNWPYAYALSNGSDSAVAGKFGVVPLPAAEGETSAACLGGWNLAVSKYSRHQKEAIDLVTFLADEPQQKQRAVNQARLPTMPELYGDPDIKAAQPIVPQWQSVLEAAVPRPSAPTQGQYNEVSKEFWTAVNETLAGRIEPAAALKQLEGRLRRLKRSAWD
ncbi:ABC transporter substrate-binding protein [Mangrovibrevibacter kandeliae]|uniref:ABC transporter substrate-binding protein n=1 Tax=Mangrovibrevibacter kandeliae TaxID=2968473 RepID=UPI002118C526|nr:ABC transporter substrate-binding protein [Aurantimonas sp. CSK15Z-1]MCQ8783627.1 ABC transporter substrate-binding protein [Aurantimonas sp. CSK15Z-1]